MKNTILFSLAVLLITNTSFAATTTMTSKAVTTAGAAIKGGADSTTADASTNPLVRLSTGVSAAALYDSTGYALVTKHVKGSRLMGTSYDSTKIFFKTDPAGILISDEVPTTSTDAGFSAWTSM